MKQTVTSLLLFGGSYAARYDHLQLGDDWADDHHYPMCGSHGERHHIYDQSPINIDTDHLEYDSSHCSSFLNWTMNWDIHEFEAHNNGHSVAFTALQKLSDDQLGGDLTDDSGNRYQVYPTPIAKLQNHFKSKTSTIEDFCLASLHFHWGGDDATGSEHTIDKGRFPLEVHFVHYACDRSGAGEVLFEAYPTYKNISDKLDHNEDPYELAVVGIMFEVSEEDNPGFGDLLSEDILDDIRLPGQKRVVDRVYLSDIIPKDIKTAGYYSYEGSLTTPPCTPIVRWHVSRAKSFIGKRQLARFRELVAGNSTHYDVNVVQAPNYRNVQENDSPVYGCFADDEDDGRNATTTAVVAIWGVLIICCMVCMALGCIWKSKREAKKVALVDQGKSNKRKRLQSKSSFGDHHETDGHDHHTEVHH